METIIAKVQRRQNSWIYGEIPRRLANDIQFSRLRKLQIHSFKQELERSDQIDFSSIHIHLKGLESLQLVRMCVKGLETICSRLTYLHLSSVSLHNAKSLSFSDGIQAIIISNTDLSSVVRLDFSLCSNLEVIDLFSCRLQQAPLLPLAGRLSFLNVSNNKISSFEIFGPNLRKIILAGNKIRYISDLPSTITYFDASRNPLRRLPLNILTCQRLKNIYFFNTEVELSVLEMRFINRLQSRTYQADSLYDDSQNVHSPYIQRSFLTSCQRLFQDAVPGPEDVTTFKTTGDTKADCILFENFKITETHVVLQCTYREVFDRVWRRIQSVDCLTTKSELKKRLVQEIHEGEGKCFTGQILRLVNTLVGFFDDIVIQISESDQVQARITAHINRNQGNLIREQLISELREIDLEYSRILEWVDSAQEMCADSAGSHF